MLYESKAISLEKWETQKSLYIDTVWEYKEMGKTIYLRKHVSGETSLDKGWNNVK